MSHRNGTGRPPRQTPYKRRYANGRTVWIARYTDAAGCTQYATPRWNGGRPTFALKGDAQRAIDEALERPRGGGPALPQKLGEYFEIWPDRYPRSKRTNKTNSDRISYVLEVEIEGRPLRDWEFDEIRRRQVLGARTPVGNGIRHVLANVGC